MKFKCLLLIALVSQAAFAPAEDADDNAAYLWRQAVGGVVLGQPTVQAHSVVMALDGGNVKAYSAAGRPLWNFSALGRLSPHVSRSREGTSYVCRTSGIFIAVNRAGRELWRVHLGAALFAPAVSGWDGRVFVPNAQKISCYTASGNLLWARELQSNISAGPWLDQGGGLMLALENGDVMRFNAYGEALVRKLSASPRILLSIGQSASPGEAPPILALHPSGELHLLNMSLPDSVPAALPRLPSAPLAAAGREGSVAVALANGQAFMLSGADGKVLWSADTGIRADNGAAVIYDERGVYVLSQSGAASITADGRRMWHTTLTNASGIPAFDESGVLYSGGTDWILYAWKLDEKTVKQTQTLYGPAPEGAYSRGVAPLSAVFEEDAVGRELESMRQEILAGRVGEHERGWLAYLMGVGGAESKYQHISHRIVALELLSRIGSSELVPWLVRLFKSENEPLVKAAAARAIGGIGVDPSGLAIHEFLTAAVTGHPGYDEQMLAAVAQATGALCRFSGPPLSDTGVRILLMLSDMQHRSSVRQQALKELHALGPGSQ